MDWSPRRTKFGNRKTVYNGIEYASMLEARFAQDLDFRLKAKDILGWERQIRIPLAVNGVKICIYILDFKVIEKDGSTTWIECKGFWTDVAKLKTKLFQALYPNDKYVVITK